MSREMLMDESVPWTGEKLNALEALVSAVFAANAEQLRQAQPILEALTRDTNFWLQSDEVITKAQSPNTIFFALNALEMGIKVKWDLLSLDSKEKIRTFVAAIISDWAVKSNQREVKRLLSKANGVLVQIVKKEINTSWPTAISDIVRSSYNNPDIFANNLILLRMLAVEIFNFSKTNFTSTDRQVFREKLSSELVAIYEIFLLVAKSFVADPQQVSPNLIRSMHETLEVYLPWFSRETLFLTDFFTVLVIPFLGEKRFVLGCLKCLGEVFTAEQLDFSRMDADAAERARLEAWRVFVAMVSATNQALPAQSSLEEERRTLAKHSAADGNFFEFYCTALAVALHGFGTCAWEWLAARLPASEFETHLRLAFKLMSRLTEVQSAECFKTCIAFWHFCAARVGTLPPPGLSIGYTMPQLASDGLRDTIVAIVLRVPKPQEVLLFIDEEGIPRRETVTSSDTTIIYGQVRDILRAFARLNWEMLQKVLTYKLELLNAADDLDFDGLNSVCWAAGTLAGALGSQEERNFLVMILRLLLQMCLLRKTTEQRSVVAANIMHIVSQNHQFLAANYELFHIVVHKLFDFMRERFPGVPEMACNIFLKICESLKHEFITERPTAQVRFAEPLIRSVLRELPDLTSDMDLAQKLVFYEGVGHVISAETSAAAVLSDLEQATHGPLNVWLKASTTGADLAQEDFIQEITVFLLICDKLCGTTGVGFQSYFDKHLVNIFTVYTTYYQMLRAGGGLAATRRFRTVRKEIVNLLRTYVSQWRDYSAQFVALYPQMLPCFVEQYVQEERDLKESQVLVLVADSISALRNDLVPSIANVLPVLIEGVVPLISQDFTAYAETRAQFFTLLEAIAEHCFTVVLSLNADAFKLVIDCVLWAAKHNLPAHYELGLDALICIIRNIMHYPAYYVHFLKYYFRVIVTDLFYVLTDEFHRNGLGKITTGLFYLISALDVVQEPLFAGEGVPAEGVAQWNKLQAFQMIATLMTGAFGNLKAETHNACLEAIFAAAARGEKSFREAVRDYLLQLNVHNNVE